MKVSARAELVGDQTELEPEEVVDRVPANVQC